MALGHGISKPFALDPAPGSMAARLEDERERDVKARAQEIAGDWLSNMDKVMEAVENYNDPARFALLLTTIFGTKNETQQAAIEKMRAELKDVLIFDAEREAKYRMGMEQ
jgi:hypothetical protein